jgi:hypothetical protein
MLAADRTFGLPPPVRFQAPFVQRILALLVWLGAKLLLRGCRIAYRGGASILQPIQAVNDLGSRPEEMMATLFDFWAGPCGEVNLGLHHSIYGCGLAAAQYRR